LSWLAGREKYGTFSKCPSLCLMWTRKSCMNS